MDTRHRAKPDDVESTFSEWMEARAHVQSLEWDATLLMDEQGRDAFPEQLFKQLQQTRQRADALFERAAIALHGVSDRR